MTGVPTRRATGGPTNGYCVVRASTNITLPLSNWTRVATNLFDNNGNLSFTNAMNPNDLQSFYRLQLQ